MAKTKKDKHDIAQRVIAWTKSVRKGKRIRTKYFSGKIISNDIELYHLRNKLMKLEEFAFDTEFSSLRMQYKGETEFVGCSFSWGKKDNYYISVGSVVNDRDFQVSLKTFIKIMTPVFSRTDVRIIGHNLKAELHALANIGIEVATDDLFDTLIACWDVDENNEIGLKEVVGRYYNYEQTHFKDLLYTIPESVWDEYEISKESELNATLVDLFIMAPYAMDDTFWSWNVYIDIQDALEEEGIEAYFYKRQMPYLKVLFNMERRGVKLDLDRIAEMNRLALGELEKLQYEIYEIAGVEFSITSGQQLAEILFGFEKQKPVYKIIYEPILDDDGNHAVYKSGARKGELKYKEIKDKDVIVGYESSANQHLLDASFNFPYSATTEKGLPKTGGDELEILLAKKYKRNRRKAEGLEMVKLILRYKKLSKLQTTYMENLAKQVYEDGKIHASFNQTGTTSGRLSSSDPNMQNLPRPVEYVDENPPPEEKFSNTEDYEKAYAGWREARDEYEFWSRFEIRDALIPDNDDEVITAHDYSNLEIRILTHFSQDPLLISMFERNVDAHGDTARNMFRLDCEVHEVKKLFPHLRQQAKSLNFLQPKLGGSKTQLKTGKPQVGNPVLRLA